MPARTNLPPTSGHFSRFGSSIAPATGPCPAALRRELFGADTDKVDGDADDGGGDADFAGEPADVGAVGSFEGSAVRAATAAEAAEAAEVAALGDAASRWLASRTPSASSFTASSATRFDGGTVRGTLGRGPPTAGALPLGKRDSNEPPRLGVVRGAPAFDMVWGGRVGSVSPGPFPLTA